jgi:hypothetical protein
MNKERYKQIIDDAYESYYNHVIKLCYDDHGVGITRPHTEEEFINRIKTEKGFSERWGLKIEERELDMFERWKIADLTPNMMEFDYCNKLCDEYNVPTKLITVTYNGEIIESYNN